MYFGRRIGCGDAKEDIANLALIVRATSAKDQILTGAIAKNSVFSGFQGRGFEGFFDIHAQKSEKIRHGRMGLANFLAIVLAINAIAEIHHGKIGVIGSRAGDIWLHMRHLYNRAKYFFSAMHCICLYKA